MVFAIVLMLFLNKDQADSYSVSVSPSPLPSHLSHLKYILCRKSYLCPEVLSFEAIVNFYYSGELCKVTFTFFLGRPNY